MKVVTVEVIIMVEDEHANSVTSQINDALAYKDSVNELDGFLVWESNITAERDATPEDA